MHKICKKEKIIFFYLFLVGNFSSSLRNIEIQNEINVKTLRDFFLKKEIKKILSFYLYHSINIYINLHVYLRLQFL